jgi:SAM-dependent methyltransferase
MYNKYVITGSKATGDYNGLSIKADPLQHDQVFETIKKLYPVGCRVLDIGCGTGAFSKRLTDNGFTVLSADIDQSCSENVKQYARVDLEDKNSIDSFIAVHGRFDLVVCMEVIEHINNPSMPVYLASHVLKPGGSVVFTTPNITGWMSRLSFLFSGRFQQFYDNDLSYGHITPVSWWQLTRLMEENNMKAKMVSSGGVLPLLWLQSPKTVLQSVLGLLLRPFMHGGPATGWCIVVVGEKR